MMDNALDGLLVVGVLAFMVALAVMGDGCAAPRLGLAPEHVTKDNTYLSVVVTDAETAALVQSLEAELSECRHALEAQ